MVCGAKCSATQCRDQKSLACVNHQVCEKGSQLVKAGTATADTVCEKCISGSTYSSKGLKCTACTQCTGSEYEKAPCTPTSDRKCEKSISKGLVSYYTFDESDPKASSFGAQQTMRWYGSTGVSDSSPARQRLGKYLSRKSSTPNGGAKAPAGLESDTGTVGFWYKEPDCTCHASSDCAGILWLAGDTNDCSYESLIGRGGQGTRCTLSWWSPNRNGKDLHKSGTQLGDLGGTGW